MDEAVEISLSPDDIVEAIALQQKGLQRLQPLSDSATSYFSLCPSSNGHYGPAEISVSPINGGPRNVFYLPGSRYALCCNDASEDLFRSQYQAVYDTRIRPSQWTLESVKVTLQYDASITCEVRARLGLEALRNQREASPWASLLGNGSTAETLEGRSSLPVGLVLKFRPQTQTDSIPGRRRKRNDAESNTESGTESDATRTTESLPRSKKAKRPRRDDQEVAKCIADKIIASLRSIQEAPVEDYRVHQAVKDIQLQCLSEKDEYTGLELRRRMAEVLWSDSQTTQVNSRLVSWANRFYSSCMRYILRKRYLLVRDDSKGRIILPQDKVKDRAADSAHTVNVTVNSLSTTCRCSTGIYAALAKLNRTMSELNGKGLKRRYEFSDYLAGYLRGNLTGLPGETPIFDPAAMISWRWGEPYGSICEALGLDNLANFSTPPNPVKVYRIHHQPGGQDERLYGYGIPFQFMCSAHAHVHTDDVGPDESFGPATPDSIGETGVLTETIVIHQRHNLQDDSWSESRSPMIPHPPGSENEQPAGRPLEGQPRGSDIDAAADPTGFESCDENVPGTDSDLPDGSNPAHDMGQSVQASALAGGSRGGTRTCPQRSLSHGLRIHSLTNPADQGLATLYRSNASIPDAVLPNVSVRPIAYLSRAAPMHANLGAAAFQPDGPGAHMEPQGENSRHRRYEGSREESSSSSPQGDRNNDGDGDDGSGRDDESDDDEGDGEGGGQQINGQRRKTQGETAAQTPTDIIVPSALTGNQELDGRESPAYDLNTAFSRAEAEAMQTNEQQDGTPKLRYADDAANGTGHRPYCQDEHVKCPARTVRDKDDGLRMDQTRSPRLVTTPSISHSLSLSSALGPVASIEPWKQLLAAAGVDGPNAACDILPVRSTEQAATFQNASIADGPFRQIGGGNIMLMEQISERDANETPPSRHIDLDILSHGFPEHIDLEATPQDIPQHIIIDAITDDDVPFIDWPNVSLSPS